MRRLGRALWWAGPWIGLAVFAWRQQGLEARLAEWVAKTNETVQAGVEGLAGAAAGYADDGISGVVGPGVAEKWG